MYTDEAMDEIFAALPELEPGLMRRYTYLKEEVDELKQKQANCSVHRYGDKS